VDPTTLRRADLTMLGDESPEIQFRQEFRVKDGVMHVRLAGRLPNELLRGTQNIFMPLIKLCEESRCKKAVIDSAISKSISTRWKFFAPAWMPVI
jgi:hypothetical protein